MKAYTIGFYVNDKDVFKKEVLSDALSKMVEFDKSKSYTTFAVSAGDEFGRLEKIESIIENCDLSDSEMIEQIETALSEIR